MLYEFLEEHQAEVLALTEDKSLKLAGALPSSEQLKKGLPLFYGHLITYLKSTNTRQSEDDIVIVATGHGKELLRLNYTLSHVVHAYGAMCQAVTELAQRNKADISTQEFNDLNLCLDIAIAAAVSEFQYRSVQAIEDREVQHLGFLVHELRNALSSATIAHEMIQQGIVGNKGSTSRVLGENLTRMRNLIDCSLSEVRMRADPEVYIEKFQLNVLVDQILLTAQREASSKQQILNNEIRADFELETDRQLLLSTIANLVQNALKYSKIGGQIFVRSGVTGKNIVIEVEDACGGIQPNVMKNIFKPFVSGGYDQSGMGLGLTIIQRAVNLLEGKMSVKNNVGHGCAFQIEIPRKLVPSGLNRAVEGEESSRPHGERP
jgi:signal transduction histidine kinase